MPKPSNYYRRKKCRHCGNLFWGYIYNIRKGFGKYCSKKCSNRANKLGFQKGHKGYGAMLGEKHSDEAKEKMSNSHKKNPTRYWKNRPFSQEHRKKISVSLAGREMPKQEYERRKAQGLFFQKGHKINFGKTRPPKGEFRKCLVCEKQIYVVPARKEFGKYCSRRCQYICPKWKEKMAKVITGRKCSVETKEKLSLAFRGAKSSLWINGQGLVTKNLRQRPQYQQWRRGVVKRDKYICVMCDSRENLQADHIIPVVDNPNLVFEIKNGRTLCRDCHIAVTNKWKKVRRSL